MKAKKIFTLAMAAVLTASRCSRAAALLPRAADPTAAPAADAPVTEAPDSEAPAALSGSVSTNGSTSMEKVVNILAEQFMNDNPGVSVTYDPTGSGTGIESAAPAAAISALPPARSRRARPVSPARSSRSTASRSSSTRTAPWTI